MPVAVESPGEPQTPQKDRYEMEADNTEAQSTAQPKGTDVGTRLKQALNGALQRWRGAGSCSSSLCDYCSRLPTFSAISTEDNSRYLIFEEVWVSSRSNDLESPECQKEIAFSQKVVVGLSGDFLLYAMGSSIRLIWVFLAALRL